MKHAVRIAALVLVTAGLAWAVTILAPSPSVRVYAAAAAAAAQEPDTDGDTMPDAWEAFFGLDPDDPSDASADPDADGLTNAQEYAARRHPVGRHTRYFAEGSTGFFDTSVALLNLSPTDTAHVAIALLNEAGGVTSHQVPLPPRQRQTVSINTVLGVSAAVAIVVESDVAVAADRFMTWGSSGIGASLDSGAPSPATTWYFAEGATGPFLLYYLFENPGVTPATVTIRYLVEAGTPVTTTRTLPPQSRTTVFVNDDDPALRAASAGSVITSDSPIFAERAMYVNAGNRLGGGSASAGSNALSTEWYFGEGSTGRFFHCFLSLLNPGPQAATATVTYHLSDGSTATKAYAVPAEGRRTVYFNGEAASDPALAALAHGPVWFTVSSTQPILGERSMWWPDWPWYEGHAAPGSTTRDVAWAVAGGRHGGPTLEETYILVGNTTATPGQVRVTLIPDTGAPMTRELPIGAGERLTLNAGRLFGLSADTTFSAIVESIGTAPTPLAVDYARYRSVNGVPFSGGGAAPAIPVPAGERAPTVTATTPAASATGVAVDANLTVTFSEPVTAGAGAFVLECPLGTAIPLTTVTASPATTFTLDPAADLPVNTACRLRVVASGIADADTNDPPDTLAADVTVPFTTSTCTAIVVNPTTVPGGQANAAYGPVTFTQTGGVAPVTWTVTAGTPPAGVQLSAAGVLAGTPTASGTSTFTVTVTDTNGCTGSAPITLSVLAGPNQAPSFTAGANQTALEDAGPRAVVSWATAISPGPSPDESGQVVAFNVTANTNPGLFAAGPAISAAGVLTYTTAPNANGAATITLVLQDNGGTAGGGVDTSAPVNVTITVIPVNDAPGFTAGANQTVAEEAGPQAVTGWATAISPGPADEGGQSVTFSVTGNTNAVLFGAGPAVSPAGDLTYTPAVDAVGTATITLTLSDNGTPVATSAPQTFTITITGVNDAPSFALGADPSVAEDSGAQTIAGFASAISPGPPDEAAQAVSFTVTGNTNAALFSAAPALSPAGDLTFTPAPNATGSATITVTLSDDGTPPATSAARSFTITVAPVNDVPGFVVGADQTVAEDPGPQSVAGWATAISAGPPDEAGQALTFTVTGNTNAALFSAGPAVAANGTLTYTPAPNAVGTATITLTLSDNGTPVATSAPQTFAITVTGVNDAPGFTAGTNQTVLEDAGAQSVASWATAISPGPADEAAQTVTFNITGNTNAALFSVAPAVSSTGTLTYTPALNASGTATITLSLSDSGGTAGGGVNTSAPQTFTITVTGVNDAPSFTAGASPSSPEDAGAQSIASWATAISPGPNEAGQTLTFAVTNNTNPTLFSAAPAVSSAGTLTYTSAPNAFGTATITLVLRDDGGTANGGLEASAPQMFTITVTPVNDAPLLTTPTITYSTLGNTQLHVQGATLAGIASISDASGVLTKSGPTDIDGPALPAAVPLSNFDTGEGTLNLNANGSFTYVPDAGFTGTDTFTAQVTDSVTPVTLTVQITVGELVYYVDNQTGPNNPPGSDGRSTDAWETLAEAEAGTPPNSTIFVLNGISATTPLAGGIALKNGQKLLGEGVGLTIAPFGTIVPAGTRPRITGAGDIVTVVANTANGDRTGVEIRGLNLSSTGGNAVEATSANTQALGVRISENVVSATGPVQDGITIAASSTANATVAVHDNTITASGAGLQIARAAGNIFITTFDDNIVTGVTIGSGIVVTGPNVFFDAVPGGSTLETVAGGVTTIGAAGDGVGVAGMLLTAVTGDLSFTDLDIVSGNGAALAVTGTGAFTGAAGTRITVGPTLGVLTATGGAAAALTNLTADLQLGGLTSTSSVANGVLLDAVGGTFTAPATAAIANATNADVSLIGGNATFTYGGTITDDVGTLVSIASTTGGAKSFTGAITDGNDGDGSGISLTNNTGATITFAGGLALSTGANPAFTATGGGTINVCDESPCNPAATGALVNVLTTTTATALNVANTTIGANNLEFRSISSDGGSSTGIILDTTGSSGGLKVKGTGGAGSGGTIANKTGADGSTSTGIGIYLNATGNVSLDRMQLKDFDNYAIRGLTVNGFALSNSVVNAETGTNGTSVAVDEGTVSFGVRSGTNGLTGTASVVNTTLEDGVEDTFSVFNTSGTLTLTMDNVSVSGSGNDGIVNQNFGTATVNLEVRNSDFSANIGDHFNATADGSANLHVQFGNNGANTLTGGAAGALGQSLVLQTGVGWAGTGSAVVSNNSINDAIDTPININIGGTGTFNATVSGNTIGTPGDVGSGTTGNKDAIRIVANGDASVDATPDGGTLTAVITNNTIQQVSGRGIFAIARDGGTAGDPIALNLTITGNLLRESPTSSGQGIRIEAGATSTDDVRVHANIGGSGAAANLFQDDWGTNLPAGIDFDEIRITHVFSTACQFVLADLGANTSTVATVAAYLSGRNVLPGGTGVASASINGTGVYETGSTPPVP